MFKVYIVGFMLRDLKVHDLGLCFKIEGLAFRFFGFMIYLLEFRFMVLSLGLRVYF